MAICAASAGISIHALREEGDVVNRLTELPKSGFLSTPSARRATKKSWFSPRATRNFYPRPPRGGRRGVPLQKAVVFQFLSTPSARRATSSSVLLLRISSNFYPRPPRGGRLRTQTDRQRRRRISIHALREEGDLERGPLRLLVVGFLSTPSARRATCQERV